MRHRVPAGQDLCLDRLDAILDELRVFDVGEIRQAQNGWAFLQFVEQQIDPRLPLRAHLRQTRLEYRIGNIEADDAVNRRTEIDAQRLTACCALHLHRRRGGAESAR